MDSEKVFRRPVVIAVNHVGVIAFHSDDVSQSKNVEDLREHVSEPGAICVNAFVDIQNDLRFAVATRVQDHSVGQIPEWAGSIRLPCTVDDLQAEFVPAISSYVHRIRGFVSEVVQVFVIRIPCQVRFL